MKHADFTLPGEAGYEKLTLELADRWGADVIRDSDGTKLSGEITDAGYGIYSTICIIRQHNKFASEHPDAQQQSFLMSQPVTAGSDSVEITLMDGYFAEQFELNESPEALKYMQVYDRTSNKEVPADCWKYSAGKVTVSPCTPFHEYTVNFLVWRVWEEINMYNHTTNNWTSEHLRQLDPRHPAAWEYLKQWLRDWCEANPKTTVIRFTSLFYNFVWIFGDNEKLRTRYCDWASYDYTVSAAALDAFKEKYGYAITAEDFINGGKLQVTHMPPTAAKRDWMAFIQEFVAGKAKELTDIAHEYGKLAYVFYDDSWVGLEPYGKYFNKMGFDGLIKCVFSGFECRLCAGADVPTHEIRLHPYLFPVGLGGAPTFSEGGDPAKDALDYWKNTRRALARKCVDRIGLGGYLHLTIGFPSFVQAIEDIVNEFQTLKTLCKAGEPETIACRVAVMHTWGSLRSWTLSGHFHETYMHNLIHINEALSGLPVDVSYISFEDAENGALDNYDVVINAGRAGDAWSGGDAWKSDRLVENLNSFVYNGGTFLGVGEPSAVSGYSTYFRMANVLGIDEDTGARVCHGRWAFDTESEPRVIASSIGEMSHLYLTDGKAKVLCEKNGIPQATVHSFGKGKGIYLSGFERGTEANRMLLDLLMYACDIKDAKWITDDARVEAAYYSASKTLLLMNNADEAVTCSVNTEDGAKSYELKPLEMKVINF